MGKISYKINVILTSYEKKKTNIKRNAEISCELAWSQISMNKQINKQRSAKLPCKLTWSYRHDIKNG